MSGVVYAFAGYLVAAIIVTFPLILSLGRSVSDPVDPILNSWIVAWVHHALLNDPREFLNANIFYPYKGTLLYSETLLVPSLLLLPIKVATNSTLLSHNLFVLSGFTFTGTSGYLLGRWLFRNHWSGWILGGVLAFNAYTLSNIGQAQLLHLEWLPLALLYLGKMLHRPTLRSALLLAAFLAAQFYTAIYYGIFSFVIVGMVGGVVWFVHRFPGLHVRLQAFGLLVASSLLALCLCLPLALPYYQLSQRYGYERTLANTWPFSASLEMWLTAPSSNLIYGNLFAGNLPKLGFYQVDTLFPGLLLLLAAASGLGLWFVRTVRSRGTASRERGGSAWWPFLLMVGIGLFFLLSLGPYPQVKSLEPRFDTVLPYAWLHEWMPGFQALRAPGRFALVVLLGLGIAVAYLFQQLHSRMARFFLLLLLAVEWLALAPATLYTPSINADQRAAYQWLAAQPPSTYLEMPLYPFGSEGAETLWLESQFQSINHWHATPLGYSGFFPPRHDELQAFLAEFPRAEVVHFLQGVGVEWLVLHQERMADEEWNAVEAAIDDNHWEAHQWGGVWVVRLAKVDAPSPPVKYYIPEVAQRGEVMGLATIYMSETPTPVIPDNDAAQVRGEWWQGERRVLVVEQRLQPPFYVDHLAISTEALPVPDATGEYTLRLFDAGQELTAATVTVVDDVAPPERELLPLRPLEANIMCHEDAVQLDILMQTIGWYDSPFTLSARLVDANGVEVGRSVADVEFPPMPPRSNLLSRHLYTLPLEEVPETEPLAVDLIAYRWQQEAQRIVPRRFVADDGAVVDMLRLAIEQSAVCKKLSLSYP